MLTDVGLNLVEVFLVVLDGVNLRSPRCEPDAARTGAVLEDPRRPTDGEECRRPA